MNESDFTPGWWDIGEADYHASPLVSRGKLHLLRESPQEFHARCIARTLPEVEPSKALRVGRLLHVAVLQPERWVREFCLAPVYNGPPEPERPKPAEGSSANTKEHKEALKRWRDESAAWAERHAATIAAVLAGREVVRSDEWATVIACASAIAENPIASWLLGGADFTERSLRWVDDDTGIACRARVDAFTATDLEQRCADLKSMGRIPTPDNFRREVVAHWYHGQAAFYSDGVRAVTASATRFPFAVVHKGGANEVAVYELGPKEIDLGRRQYKAALAEIVWRTDRDEWLADWSRKPKLLTFDQWTFIEPQEESDDT